MKWDLKSLHDEEQTEAALTEANNTFLWCFFGMLIILSVIVFFALWL